MKRRPRILNDAQVAAIMEWYRTRKTLRQIAVEVGVSPKFVQYVVGRRGEYKQPSPELRDATIRARRARLKRLAAAGWL